MMISPGHNSDTAPLSNLLAHRMWQRRRITELELERDRLRAMVSENTPHLAEFRDK